MTSLSKPQQQIPLEQVRQIWADVLLVDTEDIEDDDNFFEVGGDSVKAIQLLGRISEYGLDVDLDTLYQNRTLESFSLSANKLREHLNGQDVGHNGSIHDNNTNSNGHANGLENDNTTKDDLSTSELADVCERMGVARDAIVKIAPVTPTQEWLLEFSLQGGMILANSVYDVEGDDIEAGIAQITELLEAKIPIFRSTVVEVGSSKTYLQLLLKKGNPTWVRTSDLDAYFHTTYTEKMKLGGSPVQFAIVQNDKAHPGKTFFVISIQHSFFDVFSRSIMEKDILQILDSPADFVKEPERPWYGDFALNMRAQPDRDAALRKYWSDYLEGVPYANIHPVGMTSPSGFQDGVVQWTRLEVPASASAQQTPLALLAWTLALARQSGLRDIVFGLARHGRSNAVRDIRRTIGPFLSLTPIRLRIDGERAAAHPETVGELVERMQDQILSTSQWEQGAIPGVYPDDKGSPWVQTWVNVKSELYTMGKGYRNENGSAKITKFEPRSDLHPIWMKSHWATCILIYIKKDGVEACMGYQTSLIEHDKAQGLFADFKRLVKDLSNGIDKPVDAFLS